MRPSIVVSRGSSSSCDLRRLASLARQEYLQSRERQAQAERWLQLAAECCLDLAHHLIAERGWATPSTYREAFQTLRSEGVLDADLAGKMEGWAGLRNVLVHLYLDVDHERIHDILTADLGQLEAYAAALDCSLSRD